MPDAGLPAMPLPGRLRGPLRDRMDARVGVLAGDAAGSLASLSERGRPRGHLGLPSMPRKPPRDAPAVARSSSGGGVATLGDSVRVGWGMPAMDAECLCRPGGAADMPVRRDAGARTDGMGSGGENSLDL